MSTTNFYRIARYLKLFTNSLNVSILYLLQHGEKCVTDLVNETGEHQAYVSKQLGILYRNKLLKKRRDKVTIYYSIRNPHIFKLLDFMREIESKKDMGAPNQTV